MLENYRNVLVVDDEPLLVRCMTAFLEDLGLKAHGCTRGLDALEHLESSPGVFGLLIVDQNMPMISGMELIERAKLIQPTLQTIICSGWPPGKDGAADAFLSKPYRETDLRNLVTDLLTETRAVPSPTPQVGIE